MQPKHLLITTLVIGFFIFHFNTIANIHTYNSGESVLVGYDLDHPQSKWKLPASLLEISGNTWIDNNHLLVIEDLTPTLYLLRLDKSIVIEKTILFKRDDSEKLDLEDVTLAGGSAYALWSHGVIYKIDNWKSKPTVTKYKTLLNKGNNTEGICLDPISHNLFIVCKDNAGLITGKKSERAIYEFNLSSHLLLDNPFLLLKKKDYEKATPDESGIYPSAIAVHPVTHDIYILSSKNNKCLMIYTHSGKFKSLQLLNKMLFSQPEGICFAPDGTLYISTEGKNGVPAYLYRFNYKP